MIEKNGMAVEVAVDWYEYECELRARAAMQYVAGGIDEWEKCAARYENRIMITTYLIY